MKKLDNKNIKNSFRPIVGIDLGTTNSAVAYIHGKAPKIIASPRDEKIIPSVVLIDPKEDVVVGKDARDAMTAMPNRTVAAVKRKMGSEEGIHIADKVLLPEEISALILKELKKYVDDLLGEGEKEAVITVPAYFTDKQRRATKKAGELAGFVVERIINEPTAAAMAYGLNNLNKDQHILVYDLGGGTFDVSVVEMMSGILEVKASMGNNYLGGEDFDWRLVDWFAEKIIEKHGVDPRKDIRAKRILKHEAENTKIQLSTQNKVEISLPIVTVKNNQPIGLSVEITREEFVKLIEDLLLETMEHVETVLKEACLTAEDIDEILLVGGSTRIPLVYELISDFFGKEPRNDINPDEAVTLGAAVQSGIKSGVLDKSGMIVTDVAPFSMGIAVLKEWGNGMVRPGGYHVIIPRNTTIPVTRIEEFTTTYDEQTKVAIEIFQGKNDWVKDNHRLGEFLLEGIPANRAGEEKIEVTFKYNLNGILEVKAKCESTGEEMGVTVQDALERESQEAYEESVKKIESLRENNKEDDFNEDMFNQIMETMANDIDDELDQDKSLEELLEEAERLLKKAKGLRKNVAKEKAKKVQKIIRTLEKAISSKDKERLESIIDKVIDELIDLEI